MRGIFLAALLATAVPASAWAEPADVAASVGTTTSRTEANVKLDEGRKPAELLNFLGLEKGMRVLDMFGANQYWAEIMAPAVGPDGFVVVASFTENLAGLFGVEFFQVGPPFQVARPGHRVIFARAFPAADVLAAGGKLERFGRSRGELQHPGGQSLRIKQFARLAVFPIRIAGVFLVEPANGGSKFFVHPAIMPSD